MNLLFGISLFIVIIAIKKSKLKDIILLLSITLMWIDVSYFTIKNIVFSREIIQRFSSIIGDRAFEGDFITGITLFITSCFFIAKYKAIKNYFLITAMFIGYSYLFILESRSSLIATLVSIIIGGIIIIYIKFFKFHSNHEFEFLMLKNDTQIDSNKNGLLHKTGILLIIVVLSLFVSILIPIKRQADRENIAESTASIFNNNFHSNKIRLMFWDTSLKMFAENPVVGIGYGNWSGVYPKYNGYIFTDENVDLNSSVYAHNDYLEMLAEFGVFGCFYSIFIFWGIYRLWKKSLEDITLIPFLVVAVGYAVTSIFNFTKQNQAAMTLFIISLGIGYSINLSSRRNNDESYVKNNKLGIMVDGFLKKYINVKILKNLIIVTGILMICFVIFFKVISYLNEKTYIEAMNLKAQGKYGEMMGKLEGVSEFFYPVDMNKMPVDYYRGVGYFELRQYDKALEMFRSARRYMKYYPTVMNNEASALYMTGNSKEAEERYKQIQSIFPNYIEPQINLLALYANDSTNIYKAKELLSDIERKEFDGKYVKNYSVFLKIKNYLK